MSAWVRGNLLWKGRIFKKKSEIPQNDLTKPNIEGQVWIYYGKMDNGKEQSKYLLHVNYLERIAEVMREKNSFIPLYQIYIDGLLPMQFFTEIYSPGYYEAVYWDTLSLELSR